MLNLFSFSKAGKVVASMVNVPCLDVRSGSMAGAIALQDSGDQALELRAVSSARVLFAVDIGSITDHGCWEDFDFASELVELGVVDQDKGDGGDVALLECSCTYVHLVLRNLAPRHGVAVVEDDHSSVVADNVVQLLLGLALDDDRSDLRIACHGVRETLGVCCVCQLL